MKWSNAPTYKINERFLGFLEVTGQIGLRLEEEIVNSLEDTVFCLRSVSYTHLDVYKRQHSGRVPLTMSDLRVMKNCSNISNSSFSIKVVVSVPGCNGKFSS